MCYLQFYQSLIKSRNYLFQLKIYDSLETVILPHTVILYLSIVNKKNKPLMKRLYFTNSEMAHTDLFTVTCIKQT